jgi:Suppressor of fused protein (SUFU)
VTGDRPLHNQTVSNSEENIYRYDDGPVADNGLRGDPALVAAIEAHIVEHYGSESTIWRHPISEQDGSPIHVRIVQPTAERPAITAITVGMSERPMVAGADELSCELVLVFPPTWSFEREIDTWPLLALDQIAHFPHEYGTYLGPGHTIQNPYPWSPNGFTGALIADQALTPSDAAELMTHGGREIHFLGVLFLYQDEMQLKLDEGDERLWDLCVDAGITEAVHPERPSAAPRRKRRGLFRRG